MTSVMRAFLNSLRKISREAYQESANRQDALVSAVDANNASSIIETL
jgi:hypothetical protein